MAPMLLIRADAGPEIGTGHVMRCLALAQAWKDAGGWAAFVMAGEIAEIEGRLTQDGFGVTHIAASPGSEKDAALTAELAISQDACFVIVDGYQFGCDYQLCLKNARLRSLFIDDYGHAKTYMADLVLNQNIYASEEIYKDRDCSTQLLLGSSFILLRREFLPWRNWTRINPDRSDRLLVSLGGSDPENVTIKILSCLKEITDNGIDIVAVVGAANAHNSELHAAAMQSEVPVRLARNVSNMPELLAWADMAIISGGTTSYEAAFMGLPCLIVIIAENQILVAEEFDRTRAAISLGWHQDLSSECIRDAVENLRLNCRARESMSRIGRQLVDGQGSIRVIRAILEKVITVREAVCGDCDLIYRWANDDDTRAASFNSSPIDWDTHCRWLSGKLSNPHCLMLMCGYGPNHPFGVVRFDIAADEALISINLDPSMRGRGLGGFTIIRTVDELFKRYNERHNISVVSAFIKPENLRSAKAFKMAGFSEVGATIIPGKVALHYIMKNDDLSGRVSQESSR